MRPALVLGVGNRLMMDDGVGVAVVEELAARRSPIDPTRYEVGETDFAYCLELAEQTDQLILVDAVAAGRESGEVKVIPLRTVAPNGAGLSLHHAHLVDLLLQRDPQTSAVLIGIEPYQIGFHWGLSAELRRQFEQIVSEVAKAICSVRNAVTKNTAE